MAWNVAGALTHPNGITYIRNVRIRYGKRFSINLRFRSESNGNRLLGLVW